MVSIRVRSDDLRNHPPADYQCAQHLERSSPRKSPRQKPEHAQQLLAGKPYLRAIGDFRRDELGDGHSDPYEDMATTLMGANAERAIFCMAWLSGPIPHPLATKDGQRIKSEFASGGSAVLITDLVEFLWRFQRAEEAGIGFGIVSYDGDVFKPKDAFSHLDQVPYHKNSRFTYQHELRIVTGYNCERLPTGETIDGEKVFCGHEPYKELRLSDLDDIAVSINF